MKILFAIHGFPPHSSFGAENYAFGLTQVLKAEHEVFVFHRVADDSRPEYETKEYDYEGLRVCTINNNFKNVANFADTYRNDAIAAAFGDYLDRVRPDVVHFHHVTCLSTTCIAEAHRRGIPVFYTLHDFWLFCPRGQFITRDLYLCKGQKSEHCVFCNAYQLGVDHGRAGRLYAGLPDTTKPQKSLPARVLGYLRRRRAYRGFARQTEAVEKINERKKHIAKMCSKVHTFITPSRYMGRRATEAGIAPEKIIFSRYGYDRGQFEGFRRTPSEHLRFGFVGALIPSKGIHVLLRAFRIAGLTEARLEIFGGTFAVEGYEDYFEEIKKSAADDVRIKFAGSLENARIDEALSRIDALVVPSIWYENSPLTIEEAILTRTPMIVSNIGGMKERIGKVGGLTFRVGSAASLAGKMRMLAGNARLLESLRPDPSKAVAAADEASRFVRLYAEATAK